MAIINILAKSKKADWGKIASEVSDMALSIVQVFPIPKELGFDDDALAVNVHRGFSDKKTALAELDLLIQYLTRHNFTIIELYDGIEITSNNISQIIEPLLA
ncbi:hypothetical protein [Mucilaginibacter ginsenosidivorax]|uniref:Uncharacterized protein n=1 Tax=Mucilaginibacter ginsenosidivorax TaxID=862126 RepID=A0A5B8W693_9SPHI|nr:hypothetical protein [Mucilaginibacter ginsenosidivorax]QEC78476.1 hypothetical protein FSB76_21930 [Mucilaginibacter ginsenosidivorax]